MGALKISLCCLIFIFIGQNSVEINAQVNLQDLTLVNENPNNYTFRICVPNPIKEACEKLNDHVQDGRISCVFANDKIGCVEKVGKNEADFVPLQPEEIYIASKFKNSAFNIFGEIRSMNFTERDFRYEPVAVIRKSSNIRSIDDLKGKNSCHTGFGRNAGWKVPFSHLLDKQQLSPFCDEVKAPNYERDLYAMSKYFGKGCAPGPWAPEKEVNRELLKKYSNLCQLCENTSDCNGSDKYAGYEGALKCLAESDGDIAWTKMDAVQKYFNLNNTVSATPPISITSNFEFLCWDGSSRPLTSENPCSWAKRPWGAYLISSLHPSEYIESLQEHLKLYEAIQNDASIPIVLELNSTTQQLYKYESKFTKTVTPLTYLNLKNYTITIEKPSCPAKSDQQIRYCVTSELEKLKCIDLKLGLIGQRVIPQLNCVTGTCIYDCFQKIQDGKADVISVSPKEAAYAKRKHGLAPLLSVLEKIDNASKPEPYKFALTIVKASSSITNITDLNQTKACFGSITNLATWNTPLNVLYKRQLVQNGKTNANSNICQLNTFFNGTCVPGAKNDPQYNQFADSLCKLCIGDSSEDEKRSPGTHCDNSPLETYYGDYGALKCLDDNVADVAFIDHTTVLHLLEDPHEKSRVSSYKLLCKNGGTYDLKDYRHCNWGKVPSNVLVSRDAPFSDGSDESKQTNYVKREDTRITLLKASTLFSPLGKAPIVMNLFGPYYGNPDLMFPDESQGLIDYTTEMGVPQDIADDLDPCTPTSSAKSTTVPMFQSFYCFVLLWGLFFLLRD